MPIFNHGNVQFGLNKFYLFSTHFLFMMGWNGIMSYLISTSLIFMVVDANFFDVPFDTFIINSVSELFFKNLKQFEPILEKRVMVKA